MKSKFWGLIKDLFFNTILGFSLRWVYKILIVRGDEYHSEKKLSILIKIHLKGDVFDGSVLNGIRLPILHSFVLDKHPGYNLLFEPETNQYKKINKSNFNTKTFYSEDENHKESNFFGETLFFTLQMIKIWNIKGAFKNSKLIVIALVKNTTVVQKTLLLRQRSMKNW